MQEILHMAPKQNQPKYRHLRDDIAANITAGKWQPGYCLLPERQLAQKHYLSRFTVRKALDLLVEDGFLYRIQGSGTFVANRVMKIAVPSSNPHTFMTA
jgi:DNA-binding GntR family transcriptional regulator